ncbi:MAG: dethiobiotin synthase [Deltaproteobacteria bacterium]|nr:dethiobiotin synthase [Deltaproteobacteria bacterium]MBW2360779.1 dethiobiotin synthase [Deltaproteobacteria bacterium]
MSGGDGLFVTGTDTGVGKTVVACALLRAFRTRGIDVGAMKPIETGVGLEGPLDALALREAAGGGDALDDVCPLRFALPAAPTVAARAEGRRVEVWAIHAAYQRLKARHDCVIAEGAGGLLVPATEELSMADLARELDLPVLIVARAALGTINHTLLSLEAAKKRGLTVAGVVISHADGELSAAAAANLGSLRDALGDALLGEVPPLAGGGSAADTHIDVERLLEAL